MRQKANPLELGYSCCSLRCLVEELWRILVEDGLSLRAVIPEPSSTNVPKINNGLLGGYILSLTTLT